MERAGRERGFSWLKAALLPMTQAPTGDRVGINAGRETRSTTNMSNTLHRGKSALAPKLPGAGRAVASAELRMQIQMADLQGLLNELHVHTE